jgi:transcriptional regulator with XRE-family HTH domain
LARGTIINKNVKTLTIGEIVKELRIQKNIPLCTLAKKAKIPYQSLQNMENGTKPNFDYVVAIAKALDVPLEKFTTEGRKVIEPKS